MNIIVDLKTIINEKSFDQLQYTYDDIVNLISTGAKGAEALKPLEESLYGLKANIAETLNILNENMEGSK